MKKSKINPQIARMQRSAARAESMLKLLANARRLMVLCHLIREQKSVGELAELVDLSHSAVSQHLAKMRAVGLVASHKKGQMVYYRVNNPDVEALLSTLYLIYCR